MEKAKDILKDARRRIADPAMWGKGRRGENRPIITCCIAEAFDESATMQGRERQRAIRAIYYAAGLDLTEHRLIDWNDKPERTHDEVIKTLNLAIALVA
jgi:hypothetical protein